MKSTYYYQQQQQKKSLPTQQQNQTQPQQPIEVQEYRLVSSIPDKAHHILKFAGSRNKYDLNTFSKPIKLVRDIPQSHINYRNNLKNKYHRNNNNSHGNASNTETENNDNEKNEEKNGNISKNGASNSKTTNNNGNDNNNANEKNANVDSKLDTTKIAPFGHAQKNKQNLFKKRTKQVYLGADDTSRDKSIQEMKKEKEVERYPWLLTDFDNNITNTFTGLLEGGQHANYVLFMFSDDGFRVIPASKWYKFTPKIAYQTLTIEEAESKLAKTKIEQDRWMMRRKLKTEDEPKKEAAPITNELKITDKNDIKEASDNEEEKPRKKNDDEDDLDFDEEFQDDEEPLYGIDNDEETKEAEKKQSEQIKLLTRKDESISDEEEESDIEDENKLTNTGKVNK